MPSASFYLRPTVLVSTIANMSETYRLPDGPKTPELFNGLAFLLTRNRVIKKWQGRYGDTFSVRMPGFGQMVLVATPELVKQVYTAKSDVLHGGKNPLAPRDYGWKDTIYVRPFETVQVAVRFASWLGKFLVHCHNLEHEDHGMMGILEVK